MEKIKVLLIGDEKDLVYFLKQNLESTGEFSVIAACDSTQGMVYALRRMPEVIVLDIMLPGKDGLEVLKELKSHEKTLGIPVIMLTALEDDRTKLAASGFYAQEYLVKPVDYLTLRERIHKMVQTSRIGA